MSGRAMDGVTVLPDLEFPVRWITKLRSEDGLVTVEGRQELDSEPVTLVLPVGVVLARLEVLDRDFPIMVSAGHGNGDKLAPAELDGFYIDASGEPILTDLPLPPKHTVVQPPREGVETDLSDIIGDDDADRIVAFTDYGSTLRLTEQCDRHFRYELDVDQVRRLTDWLQAWLDGQADRAER